LYNYAMPLIRYDHGDEARPGQRDACKVTLPALAEVFGRRIPGPIAP
jgi:phenylacetate-coenzyme A ligase PaaK-like adenylate-forming protein